MDPSLIGSGLPCRLGLTGGIGSGKSTVATMFVARGATLIDTDAIAREITGPGGMAMPMLVDEFGRGVTDSTGALDRARMRELVFADATVKRRLESILHPVIGVQAQRQADTCTSPVVVFDVPLLVESSHWRARCHRILVVDCSVDVQVQRVMERSGWHEAQVRSVIAQQATRERRRAVADAVIFNDAIEVELLESQVARLWLHWFGPGMPL